MNERKGAKTGLKFRSFLTPIFSSYSANRGSGKGKKPHSLASAFVPFPYSLRLCVRLFPLLSQPLHVYLPRDRVRDEGRAVLLEEGDGALGLRDEGVDLRGLAVEKDDDGNLKSAMNCQSIRGIFTPNVEPSACAMNGSDSNEYFKYSESTNCSGFNTKKSPTAWPENVASQTFARYGLRFPNSI